MNVVIVLIHNKSDQENIAQIEALKPHILQIADTNTDQDGNVFTTYHYELQDLPNVHIKFFQIIPFGSIMDNDMLYSLDSYKVFYSKGDEDKIGDHPRFFNYGMRFPIDSMGADVVIHVNDYKTFNINNLSKNLQDLADNDMATHPWGHITTTRILTHVGEIDESEDLNLGMQKFKDKIIERGLKHG